MDQKTHELMSAIAQNIHRGKRSVDVDYVEMWTPPEIGLRKWLRSVIRRITKFGQQPQVVIDRQPNLRERLP